MAKNKVFRLTEEDVKIVLENVARRILKEGSIETADIQAWDEIEEMVGAHAMLQMVWDYLDVSQIQEFIGYMRDELNLDSIGSMNDEDEDEMEDDFEDEEEI